MRTDPLHDAGPTSSTWTTVNAAEAMPGVATPLGWTAWFECCELGLRGAFADIGVLPTRDVRVFPDLDDRFVGIFHGHFAGNLDVMRRMADAIPGSSGDAYEEQFHAGARQGTADAGKGKRLPLIVAKLPHGAWRARRDLRRLGVEIDQWWRRAVAAGSTADVEAARAVVRESRRYLIASIRPHTVVSMIGQGLFEQVRRTCERAGKPGLELRLLNGDDGLQETRMVADLWEVAVGRRSLDDFLLLHGFHGPAAGELSSHTWREDPAPVEALLAAYRERDAPATANPQQERDRAAAQAELMSALSRLGRIRARAVLGLARTYIPLRENGRGTFLKATDVLRCMARRLGAHLADAGALEAAEDVFYLTVDELLGDAPPASPEEIAFRRARRDEYLRVELPESWTGVAEPRPLSTASAPAPASGSTAVSGIGVSPGVAEGRAVVILDPAAPGDIAAGDILVCCTTDPSWASIFYVVSGCVIDIGGPMSHGAIVARELGLPCVINTRNGTQAIASGDRVRVDGASGTVDVLARVGS